MHWKDTPLLLSSFQRISVQEKRPPAPPTSLIRVGRTTLPGRWINIFPYLNLTKHECECCEIEYCVMLLELIT